MLFKAILDGFPKSQRTLVAFVSVFLSETAGAGNGLIRKSQHRRVMTRTALASAPSGDRVVSFGSNLDGPEQPNSCTGGQVPGG